MTQPPSLPLRWHLVRLAVGTLLPAVAFAAVVAFQLASLEREATERRAVQSARALAADFEREISGSIRTLQALAESEPLARGDLEAFLPECERVRRTQPAWKLVLLHSSDGQPLLNTSLPWGAPLPAVAEPESFARVLQTQQPLVGDLAVGRAARREFAFPVRVPVMRDGVPRYVLSAIITPESLAQVVASQSSGYEEWTRTLVDQQGRVAARTRDPARFVGQSATPSFLAHTRASHEDVYADESMDGASVYVAFSRSRSFGWTAAIISPRQVMDAPVRDAMLAVGGLGLVLLLVSASGVWVFSRWIERSITQAVNAAAALALGTPPHMEPSSVCELGQLGEALESSGRLLQARERERDALLALAEEARAEAVEATRAKDVFLALLGHELRNPLAPIVSSMEVLRLRGLASTPEHEVIARQLRHVVRLVDDLLDLARISRGQMSLHREPIELSSVVARAVEAAAPLIEQRRHVLEVDVPSSGTKVLADADRLTQVVANLLTNAAKYTPPGGRIQVRARERDEGLVLVVDDNGQGLPPDLVPRLFEPFVRGTPSSERNVGGLGIGLALVRSLVEAHGGRVEAHSDGPGRGSTFSVWLPRHARAEAASTGEARREQVPLATGAVPESPLRLLLVDDNVDAAEMLAELLGLRGYEVVVAHDGSEALLRVEGFRPQVALLDIGLPDMDGYELAECIRERLGEESPVFAALTGYGQEGNRDRSRAASFRHHFVKPIDIDALNAFLETLPRGRPDAT